jgi:hypothetical protein
MQTLERSSQQKFSAPCVLYNGFLLRDLPLDVRRIMQCIIDNESTTFEEKQSALKLYLYRFFNPPKKKVTNKSDPSVTSVTQKKRINLEISIRQVLPFSADFAMLAIDVSKAMGHSSRDSIAQKLSDMARDGLLERVREGKSEFKYWQNVNAIAPCHLQVSKPEAFQMILDYLLQQPQLVYREAIDDAVNLQPTKITKYLSDMSREGLIKRVPTTNSKIFLYGAKKRYAGDTK